MSTNSRLIAALTFAACWACSSEDPGDHSAAGGSTAVGGATHAGGASGGIAGMSESGTGGINDADAPIVPQDLSVIALPGGNGGLDVTGLTLRRVASGVEIYAALKNDGDLLACSVAFSVELYDQDQVSVTAAVGGLLTQKLYQLTDGSGNFAACLAPGETGMAQVTGLPDDLVIDDIKYIVYRSPHFALDATPVDGFSVSDLKAVPVDDGSAYTGVFSNSFDVAVNNPGVTVFAINGAGRPLGIASASRMDPVPPRGGWEFTTDNTDVVSADAIAFPTGSPELSN